ncbi:VOC family protein [Haladaptatus salinisoli]|uniref:VOC family protein n=1 Tax=Haladaptatus salinisoli TaxID=2884876 RepID=UPI001D099FC1|nr:VOC family protein [Haladaptatus salinisoli]
MELLEIALFTEDVPITSTFYERLLGESESASDSTAIFDVEGNEVLVHEAYDEAESDPPREDHWSPRSVSTALAFAVEDIGESFAASVESGLTVFREPDDYDRERSAYLEDPDGRLVELTERWTGYLTARNGFASKESNPYCSRKNERKTKRPGQA